MVHRLNIGKTYNVNMRHQQYMLLKIRKLVLSSHLNLVPCSLSFSILNISNCQSVLELHHELFKFS